MYAINRIATLCVVWPVFSLILTSCTANERTANVGPLPVDTPPLAPSFFDHCAFVCVDVQPGGRHVMREDRMPEGWRKAGFTVEDVNAANAYLHDVAKPNALRVADGCRRLELPMIFIHWGYTFRDGMDLAPAIRRSFVAEHGENYDRWPHHISRPDSKPADFLGVREGEYVIAKTGQDAFPSSNTEFVLQNLGVKQIVFVGGHTGACLGKTAASAKRAGYRILCVADATFDARESSRLPNLEATGYDYVVTTEEFLGVVAKTDR